MKMKVDKALRAQGECIAFALELPAPVVDFEALDIGFVGGVTLTGFVTGIGDSVVLSGILKTQLTSECARCLEPVSYVLEVSFDEIFVRQPDPDHPDAYPFEGSEVDLTDLVVASIAMNLPMQLLCNENCKGLCLECGQNLNLGSCGCDPVLERSAFSALKALLYSED